MFRRKSLLPLLLLLLLALQTTASAKPSTRVAPRFGNAAAATKRAGQLRRAVRSTRVKIERTRRALGRRLLGTRDARRRHATVNALGDRGVNRKLAQFATRYYQRIERASEFERVMRSDVMRKATADNAAHPSVFSTHGLSHVEDVVSRVAQVLDSLQRGGWIARRRGARLGFLRTLAVNLAAMHDIGNGVDGFSRRARNDHRQFSAQVVMTRDFDPVVRSALKGPLGRYLKKNRRLLGDQTPEQVLREMLAGGVLHDRVPDAALRSPEKLADHMRKSLREELSVADSLGPASDRASSSYKWLDNPQLFADFRDAAALAVTTADTLRARGQSGFDSSGAPTALHRNQAEVVHWKFTRSGKMLPASVYPSSIETARFPVSDAAISSARLDARGLVVELGSARPLSDAGQRAFVADAVAMQIGEMAADSVDRLDAIGSGKQSKIILHRAMDEAGLHFAEAVVANLPGRLQKRVVIAEPPRRSIKQRLRARASRSRQRKHMKRGRKLDDGEAAAALELLRKGGVPVHKARRAASALATGRRLELPSNSELFRHGDPVHNVYLVASGGATLIDDAGRRTELSAGVVLGQEAAMSGSAAASRFDVRLTSDGGPVELIAIDADTYAKAFSEAIWTRKELMNLAETWAAKNRQ